MHKSKLVLLSFVMITGLAGIDFVAAQTAAPSTAAAPKPAVRTAATIDTSFQALDKHRQGYLVRSDVPRSMGNLRAHFIEYDRDHDGRLSSAEYAQYVRDFSNKMTRQQTGHAVSSSSPSDQGAGPASTRLETDKLLAH